MADKTGLRRLLESRSRLLVVAAGAAVLGCGDSQSPPQAEPCPDNLVAISVQNPSAATPTFTWAPSCPVTIVQVSALAPASGIAWSIGGNLENIIHSGVRYGRVPDGATGGQFAPLQAGVTYEVRVSRAIPSEDGPGIGGGGVTTFTH